MGKANDAKRGEIAAALGIGLEGAKWHVSEILSKLQVERREDAAEYWRYQNGLRMRFLRAVRGAGAALGLRWLMLAAAGAAVAAAVAVIITVFVSSDGTPASPGGIPSPAPLCAEPSDVGDDQVDCQVLEAPASTDRRLVPDRPFGDTSGGGEIRLTYGELMALIADAVRTLKG